MLQGGSSLSVIIDLRCAERADALTDSLRDLTCDMLCDFVVSAAIDYAARSKRQQRLGTGDDVVDATTALEQPANVSLLMITAAGPTTVVPRTPVTPEVVGSIGARVHTAATAARAAPLRSAIASDPLVLQAVAVRAALDVAADPSAVSSTLPGGATTTSHVILLVAAVGPSIDGPSVSRLLPGSDLSSGATLTACLVLPGAEKRSDVFLTSRVRVVRPRPDRRSVARCLSPVLSVGLGLTKTASATLHLPVASPSVAPEEVPSVAPVTLALRMSSCCTVDEATPDWLRNGLVAWENRAAPIALHVESVLPAAAVSEAWLAGVAAVAQIDGASQAAKRDGFAVFREMDWLRYLTDDMRANETVLLLRVSATTPLQCIDAGGATTCGRPWYVGLPWQRDSACLLLRQLVPYELRRADTVEQRRRDAAESPADEETKLVKSRAEAFMKAMMNRVDPASLRGDLAAAAIPHQQPAATPLAQQSDGLVNRQQQLPYSGCSAPPPPRQRQGVTLHQFLQTHSRQQK
jgi:hypothetical protein